MAIVYLLGDWEKDGIYKIGVTRGDLDKRIKKLQTGNVGEIYVVNYFETEFPFRVESLVHQRLFGKRKRGEWFELDADNVIKFKEMCEQAEEIARVMNERLLPKGKIK